MRKKFDLVATEIGRGSILIEASAGTGKTFTIAGLVLRLLIERPELTIDRILVTTFTELATSELRTRIRELLQRAERAFRSGVSDDALLAALLERYRDRSTAADRLRHAISEFDQAPIYTIHGFCQRVLAERAFESGTLFDAELVTNQGELLREIVHDFWRIHFYGGDKFAALLALRAKITPDRLLDDLEELTKNPTLTILPEELRSCRAASERAREALEELRSVWREEQAQVRAAFTGHTWAKSVYKDEAAMARLLDDLEQCLSADGGTAEQLRCLEVLAERVITAKGVKVKKSLPQLRTFRACEELADVAEEFCTALRAEFYCWAREELRARKQSRNVLGFEDLLTRLDDALAGAGGAELAESIRGRYAAALVDEFQDTDPVQYSIFAQIYGKSDATVAFIGDPKQAIYAFRGADVFTYLNAARAARRQFTLGTNWRSESGLVQAVNAVFDRPAAFLLDEIAFLPAAPGPDADQKPLRVHGAQEPPFHIWTATGEEELPQCVASEIVRLLASGVTIGDEALEPRHIAVLTSTNAQAARVQEALRARGVPSVLYSSASVFASREAAELRDVLAAVAQPGHEKFVRAALCTDALGRTGNDLDELSRDENRWEGELLRFQKHHQLWRDRGFIQMLRQLAIDHGVRQRLLSYPDGERRLTNFLHLAELLHAACAEQRLGMTGLLKWLAQQMQEGSSEMREEHELRLESDEKAVRIITVHKSKGLEFEVVFCPWVTAEAKTRATFHDPDAEFRLTLDLGNPEAQLARREAEALAESLRLFYVAVTRAKNRCTMVWRAGAKPEKCAPAYLLGTAGPPLVSSENIAIGNVPEAKRARYRSAAEETPLLQAREFTGAIDRSWGVASFSRLISGREADPRLDEGLPVEKATLIEEATALQGIHAFPRGMRAGTCLHEIIEQVEFGSLTSASEIVKRKLRAYGIEGFDEVVLENVRRLAQLPLGDFTLAQTQPTSRIAELEFHFPVNALTTSKLAAAFGQPLAFTDISGFMNGFIDLVVEHEERFYFIDWKSNWLGPNLASYTPAALRAEMQRHVYTLQLSLYTVALHRYLQVRKRGYDYEQHFGGAFYIFLRGIDEAQPQNGVYTERLTKEQVERLDVIFRESQ
ncbi:exodeoxyribonuclease V subunit beta [soil metagenome]